MSKGNYLLALAAKLENKYAAPLFFESGNDRITISERLYIAGNHAIRASNLLEKCSDDPAELKDLNDKMMITGFIEEASDQISQALVMYKNLLTKRQ